MSDFEFDLPITQEARRFLLDIVKMAEKRNIRSMNYSSSQERGTYTYHVQAFIDGTDSISAALSEKPTAFYETLDFISYDEEKHLITLKPKVFKWAKYENKNRLLRFLARLPNQVKDLMIVVAFVLSLGLTVIQIVQAFKTTP